VLPEYVRRKAPEDVNGSAWSSAVDSVRIVGSAVGHDPTPSSAQSCIRFFQCWTSSKVTV
jgi:hypothetical protein